jgi:hypothetical protein
VVSKSRGTQACSHGAATAQALHVDLREAKLGQNLIGVIDKHEHTRRYVVWQFHPYHYCMRALVERYVLWLNRHRLTGDVIAEPRFKKQDKRLKRSFTYIYDHGTEHIPASTVQRCLTSREIKFEPKEANVCGLQLVEMIAHPSHQALKAQFTGEPMTARFGQRVVEILLRSRHESSSCTFLIMAHPQARRNMRYPALSLVAAVPGAPQRT